MVAGPGAEGHEHHAHGEHGEHGDSEVARAMDAIRAGDRRATLRRRLLALVFGIALLALAAELSLRLSSARDRAAAASLWRSDPRRAALLERFPLVELPDPVLLYGPSASPPQGAGEVSSASSAETLLASPVDAGFHPGGARKTEVPRPKPAGERRLLLLGGTLTCGASDSTPARRLEDLTRAAGPDGSALRVLDRSVPGYRLAQAERVLAGEGLALEPDLVLLCFGPEEVDRNALFLDPERRTFRRDLLPLPLVLRRPLWRVSHLYGWIAEAHARASGADSGDLDPRVPTSPLAPENQRAARETLARMNALCRARGIPFFAAGVFPRAGPLAELSSWFSALLPELGLSGDTLEGEGQPHDAELAARLHDGLRRAQLLP